ncbi:MAG: hypothetical protein ABWZ98_04020, partial [Nakamurella sp.]
VSGAARQAVPGGEQELARLEAAAALHPVLREIATDLHVVAHRPADGRAGVADGQDNAAMVAATAVLDAAGGFGSAWGENTGGGVDGPPD